jgi:hypothetical protein
MVPCQIFVDNDPLQALPGVPQIGAEACDEAQERPPLWARGATARRAQDGRSAGATGTRVLRPMNEVSGPLRRARRLKKRLPTTARGRELRGISRRGSRETPKPARSAYRNLTKPRTSVPLQPATSGATIL